MIMAVGNRACAYEYAHISLNVQEGLRQLSADAPYLFSYHFANPTDSALSGAPDRERGVPLTGTTVNWKRVG
jgi:hypothetical protein